MFTGDEWFQQAEEIRFLLKKLQAKGSFFFTGNLYRNKKFAPILQRIIKDGHYLGPHSDQHLLYCDWTKRDSLLVDKQTFTKDLLANIEAMPAQAVDKATLKYFIPPYEWYNDSIAKWSTELGFQLFNFTPGLITNADYTTPEMKNYRSNTTILEQAIAMEKSNPSGLNGFILLSHIGSDPKRKEGTLSYLFPLLNYLNRKGYRFVAVNELLRH